jgi:hypothetical protein
VAVSTNCDRLSPSSSTLSISSRTVGSTRTGGSWAVFIKSSVAQMLCNTQGMRPTCEWPASRPSRSRCCTVTTRYLRPSAM